MTRAWVRWALALLWFAGFGLSRAVGAEPGIPSDLVLGRAALEDGLHDLARRHFERALQHAGRSAQDRSAAALGLARALMGQGRHTEATAILDENRKWVEQSPNEDAFWFWYASALYESGRWSEAFDITGFFALQLAQSPYAPQAERLRGRCLLVLDQPEEAFSVFQKLHERHPTNEVAAAGLLDWAGALLERHRPKEGRKVLEELIRTNDGGREVQQGRLWLGRLLADEDEVDAAQAVLLELGRDKGARAEQRTEAWMALARLYERQTNFPATLDALEQAGLSARDDDARLAAEVDRGRLLLQKGRVEDGLAVLRAAAASVPTNALAGEAWLMIAQAELDREAWTEALDDFQRYLESFNVPEGQARAQEGKGWALWKLGRFTESASAFDRAYALHAESMSKAQTLFKAADAYFATNQFQLAGERYTQFLSEFATNALRAQAQYQSAECLARQGRLDAAIRAFLSLVDEDPDTPLADRAQLRVGALREEQGDWDGAIRAYSELLTGEADEAIQVRAFHGRALIHYRQGRFQQALADFNVIVADFPQGEASEQAYYMRGWCMYLLGRHEEALKLCEQFVEKYPDSIWAPNVLFWIGEYHYNHGQFELAELSFDSLATNYSNVAVADEALFWAGKSAVAQKEYVRALDHFNRLTVGFPNSSKIPEARFAQGDALSELGQFPAAILVFDEVLQKYPNTYLIDLARGRKGDCHFTLGKDDPRRYMEALSQYRTVLDSPTASTDLKLQAEFKMGRCHEKLQESAQALEHYMRVVYKFLYDLPNQTPADALWFTRAAFNAAAIKEAERRWREAVSIYRRVVDAGVPAAADAQERINRIRLAHWILF